MKRKFVFIGIALLTLGIVAIIFSSVHFPFETQERYYIPKSSIILEEHILVTTNSENSRTLVLNKGDQINIEFRVISRIWGRIPAEIAFHFRDGIKTVFSLTASTYNSTTTIANDSTYYAVWNNAWGVDEVIVTRIAKIWNEVAYRHITITHTVIPSEYTIITEYFGILFILAGIAGLGLGIKFNSTKSSYPQLKTPE